MAQLRIQPKLEKASPRAMLATALPIGVLLAGGLATTMWLQNGRAAPAEALADAMPQAQAAWAWAQGTWLAVRPIEAGGRAWVPAGHPAVPFDDAEMVPVGLSDGWPLYANRVQGLPALSPKAGPYDRVYVRSTDGTYVPLRWNIP